MANNIISMDAIRGDYWYDGETWDTDCAGFGYIINSDKELYIVIPNPKNIGLLTNKTITVERAEMEVHQSNGCIIAPSGGDFSEYTSSELTVFDSDGAVILFKFVNDSGFTRASGTILNAAPVVAVFTRLVLTFN